MFFKQKPVEQKQVELTDQAHESKDSIFSKCQLIEQKDLGIKTCLFEDVDCYLLIGFDVDNNGYALSLVEKANDSIQYFLDYELETDFQQTPVVVNQNDLNTISELNQVFNEIVQRLVQLDDCSDRAEIIFEEFGMCQGYTTD